MESQFFPWEMKSNFSLEQIDRKDCYSIQVKGLSYMTSQYFARHSSSHLFHLYALLLINLCQKIMPLNNECSISKLTSLKTKCNCEMKFQSQSLGETLGSVKNLQGFYQNSECIPQGTNFKFIFSYWKCISLYIKYIINI